MARKDVLREEVRRTHGRGLDGLVDAMQHQEEHLLFIIVDAKIPKAPHNETQKIINSSIVKSAILVPNCLCDK